MTTHNLTIIIPHYNSSKLLEKLLSTIPIDENIEVIVVDDKSDDTHTQYIEELQKSAHYTKFILLTNASSKKGAGTARNIGLAHATGQWILFADADDYFTATFYESISAYFDSHNDVVFFKPTSIYIDTEEIADRHLDIVDVLDNYLKESNKKNELKLRFNFFPPWAKLIKRDLLIQNNIHFDEIIAANDVMFSTKVGYYMRNFEVSDSTVYVLTRSHGSLTANMSEAVFDIRLQTILEYHDFLKNRLSTKEFKLLDLSQLGRTHIVRSMKYGMLKTLQVAWALRNNDFKFFHAKWLNPLHLVSKTLQYKKNNLKNEKYITNEKI